ncbi:MAG: transposase [Nannocystaceae bacterium]
MATGTRAGRRVKRVGDRVDADDVEALTSPRCARVQGFSLHANVAVPARDRKRMGRLLRYIARPPIATERLHRRSDGRLVYLFRKSWRDGTRGVVYTELIEKLVALIPPPQANMVRYHGVLAPGSKLRRHIVGDRRQPMGAKPSTTNGPWRWGHRASTTMDLVDIGGPRPTRGVSVIGRCLGNSPLQRRFAVM